MRAMVKNRNNYELIDFIVTAERNKKRAFIEIIMFAMDRFNLSKDHHIISDYGITIVYDDKIELICPIL